MDQMISVSDVAPAMTTVTMVITINVIIWKVSSVELAL